MKIKIKYNGAGPDSDGIEVQNAKTGEPITGIAELVVHADHMGVSATMTFIDLELELDNLEAERREEAQELHGSGSSRDNK